MTRKQFFKMNKRTATIMLALMLTTSTLTACGKKNEPSTNNPAPTVGADNQAETNGKFKAGVYTAKVMGMHDMTVTVTVSADKIEDENKAKKKGWLYNLFFGLQGNYFYKK